MKASGWAHPAGKNGRCKKFPDTQESPKASYLIRQYSLARIFHAFEMFMGKASGAPLYFCYRKPLITPPRDISNAPVG